MIKPPMQKCPSYRLMSFSKLSASVLWNDCPVTSQSGSVTDRACWGMFQIWWLEIGLDAFFFDLLTLWKLTDLCQWSMWRVSARWSGKRLIWKLLFFEYKTEDLPRVCGSVLMILNIADDAEEKIDITGALRPITAMSLLCAFHLSLQK